MRSKANRELAPILIGERHGRGIKIYTHRSTTFRELNHLKRTLSSEVIHENHKTVPESPLG